MAEGGAPHKAHLIWVVALAALTVDVVFALVNWAGGKFLGGFNVTKLAISSK